MGLSRLKLLQEEISEIFLLKSENGHKSDYWEAADGKKCLFLKNNEKYQGWSNKQMGQEK